MEMSLFDISMIIGDITPYFIGLCLLVGLIQFRRISPPFKLMVIYLGVALLFNLGMSAMAYYFGNNLVLIPLYGFFELVLYTVLFGYFLFTPKSSMSTTTVLLGITGCSYIIYETLIVNTVDPLKFQSYARVIDAFIIVVFSMLFFFDKLSKGTDPKETTLTLNTIILIFFSLNLVFLLPINFLVSKSYQLVFYFWFGYMVLTLLFYLSITFAIWKDGRTRRP